jgi:hypothetical protein
VFPRNREGQWTSLNLVCRLLSRLSSLPRVAFVVYNWVF